VEIDLVIQSAQDGSVQNVHCTLDRLVVVGRDPESPVQLQGPGISREHFGIEESAGTVLLHDMSANGTWVNGARLEKGRPRDIQGTDVVEIPGYRITFKIPIVAPPAPQVTVAPTAITQIPAIQEIPAAPVKKSFLQPVTAVLASLSLLEKLLIITAVVSIWLGIYYYTS